MYESMFLRPSLYLQEPARSYAKILPKLLQVLLDHPNGDSYISILPRVANLQIKKNGPHVACAPPLKPLLVETCLAFALSLTRDPIALSQQAPAGVLFYMKGTVTKVM